LFDFFKKYINLSTILLIISMVVVFIGGTVNIPEESQETVLGQTETQDIASPDDIEIEETGTKNDDLSNNTDIPRESTGDGTTPEAVDPDTSLEITEEDDAIEEDIDETDIYKQDDYQDIDFTNSEDFSIEVDLSLQRVYIFYEDNLIREMICSGGTEENPTPLGEYATNEKIEYSFIPRFDVGAYYWVRFFGAYLFHSVPFDIDGNMIIEEKEKLGSPASHGCIRLKLDEAKWLYDNLPLGVKVQIYYEKS